MKTYSVTFNNINDCRSVISNVDYKTAIKIYTDTREHRRFFQDSLNKEENNTGVVTLICDQSETIVFENSCKRVRK